MDDVDTVPRCPETRMSTAPPASVPSCLPPVSPWLPPLPPLPGPPALAPRAPLLMPGFWWGAGGSYDATCDVREPAPAPFPPAPLPPMLLLPDHTMVARRKRREQRPRRQRTTFSGEQTLALELEFRRAEYVTRTRRVELAERLSLSESQVKIWFQNRRAKDKRIEKARLDQQLRSMGFGTLPHYAPGYPLTTPLSAPPSWTGWLRPQSASHAPNKTYGDD